VDDRPRKTGEGRGVSWAFPASAPAATLQDSKAKPLRARVAIFPIGTERHATRDAPVAPDSTGDVLVYGRYQVKHRCQQGLQTGKVIQDPFVDMRHYSGILCLVISLSCLAGIFEQNMNNEPRNATYSVADLSAIHSQTS
jgi:hypothetical protein